MQRRSLCLLHLWLQLPPLGCVSISFAHEDPDLVCLYVIYLKKKTTYFYSTFMNISCLATDSQFDWDLGFDWEIFIHSSAALAGCLWLEGEPPCKSQRSCRLKQFLRWLINALGALVFGTIYLSLNPVGFRISAMRCYHHHASPWGWCSRSEYIMQVPKEYQNKVEMCVYFNLHIYSSAT